MVGADHARIDHQRGLERGDAAAVEVAVEILGVHEHVGTRLELGEHAQLEVDRVGARARAGDDPGREPRFGQRSIDGAEIYGALLDRGAAGGEILDVLLDAAVELDASVAEAWAVCERLGKRDRRLG